MSVVSVQKQQAVDGAVKKIDGDICLFASCLEKAKTCTCTISKHECLEELQMLMDKLRQHRDQVRTWSTQSGNQNPDSRSRDRKRKLVDARQRIEHEMKRFEELTNNMDMTGDTSEQPVDTASEASSGQEISEKVAVDQVLAGDGMNDEMVAEFTCRICMVHVVGCGPVLTRCSHLFCGDCIQQWFAMNPGNTTWAQRAQSGGSVPCPVCKEPLHKDKDLHPVSHDGDGGSKMLHKLLSATRIMCAKNPKCCPGGNCDWIGDYASYPKHIRICQNLPVYAASPPEPQAAPVIEQTCAAVLEPNPTDAEMANSEVEDSLVAIPEDATTSISIESIECSSTADSPVQAATEEQVGSTVVDLQLMELLSALVEPQAKDCAQCPAIEIEDTCSTYASEQPGSLEPSDADLLSDHLPSPAASDAALSNAEVDEAQAQAARLEAEQRRWHQVKAYEAAYLEKLTQQRAVLQYQAAVQWQQQAAQYQVEYQAAQYRAAAQYQVAMASYQQQAVHLAQFQQINQAATQAKAMQGQAKKVRGKK